MYVFLQTKGRGRGGAFVLGVTGGGLQGSAGFQPHEFNKWKPRYQRSLLWEGRWMQCWILIFRPLKGMD